MKLTRCPTCHSHIHLEALIQDDAASELLGLLARLDKPLSRAMVSYLGLFRPAKSDLSHARALRLAEDVLELGQSGPLVTALETTVKAIWEKRQQGQSKPLANHNYLKQVLGGLTQYMANPQAAPQSRPSSKPPARRFQTNGDEMHKWREDVKKLGFDPDTYYQQLKDKATTKRGKHESD